MNLTAILVISSVIITLVYVVLILLFRKGWNRIPLFVPHNENLPGDMLLSVIVCVRNEAMNLSNLFRSIQNQTYQNFELIVVNDHSTDNSITVIDSFARHDPRIKPIIAKGEGKKRALKEGIAEASGEVIIQTDADCMMSPEWLQTIAHYVKSTNTELLVGPVKIQPESFFGEMQALEFMSLVASGAGAIGLHSPIMCNGANLIYKKDIWNELVSDQREEYRSGDDMFLLLAAKKKRKKIAFLKSPAAIVSTHPVDTVKALFRQRGRWSSKSTAYRDPFLIFTALSIAGIAILPIILGFSGQWMLFSTVFLTKMLTDSFFLSSVAPFFGLKKTLRWILPISILYPFYISGSLLTGIFMKNKW
jgi:cellulose synthase/poly-beta-1,6-N-acetylglucosamine synthase-like glycosyltransferase